MEARRRSLIITLDFFKFLTIFKISWVHLKLSQQKGADVRALKASWTQQIFQLMKVEVKASGQIFDFESVQKLKRTQTPSESIILVGNHTSYLDIPLVMNREPSCCFVSKQEVKYWPVIGKGAVKCETIFVQRESYKSRKNVRGQIIEALKNENKKLVIFPSGTTTLGPSAKWKKGAFEIAHQGKIKVQLFRVKYSPERPVAYIDNDFFPTHVMDLFKEPSIQAQIEFGESFYVQDVMQDLARSKAWCETPFSV